MTPEDCSVRVGTNYAVRIRQRKGDGPFAVVVSAREGSDDEGRVGMGGDKLFDLAWAARKVNLDLDPIILGRPYYR
jgi:hypothetical protein